MAKKDFMALMKEKTTEVRPSLLSSEEAIKRQLTVLDRLQELIPPLSEEEHLQLEQNVRTHGIKDPLTIWETTSSVAGLTDKDEPVFILVDGHNRYRLSQQHSLDFRINLVRFTSLDEVIDYMIDYQLGRRNLRPEQVSYLRGLRYNQQKTNRGGPIRPKDPPVNVAQTLGEEYGVSSRTIKRDGEFAAGVDRLSPSLKRDVLTGKQKLTKSAMATLAKRKLAGPVEQIHMLLDTIQPLSTPQRLTVEGIASLDASQLQSDIRALANGPLTRKACTQLISKVNELLALRNPK